MIVNPIGGGGFGFIPGNPPTRRWYPKPQIGQFFWIFQSAGATMSNVTQGLQLVSPVAGAGGTVAACIGSLLPLPSVSRVSLQNFSTDVNNTVTGATQVYGASVGLYDSVHGQMVAVGFSARSGQPPGNYSIGRFTRKVFSGADGGLYTTLINGIGALPNIISITFDGTNFAYYYGATPGSLHLAGTDTLTTIQAIDPAYATYFPNTAAIWQENQNGQPQPPPGINTSVFSGFQVAA